MQRLQEPRLALRPRVPVVQGLPVALAEPAGPAWQVVQARLAEPARVLVPQP